MGLRLGNLNGHGTTVSEFSKFLIQVEAVNRSIVILKFPGVSRKPSRFQCRKFVRITQRNNITCDVTSEHLRKGVCEFFPQAWSLPVCCLSQSSPKGNCYESPSTRFRRLCRKCFLDNCFWLMESVLLHQHATKYQLIENDLPHSSTPPLHTRSVVNLLINLHWLGPISSGTRA